MPGVSRDNQDLAGGLILGGGQTTVYSEGKLITVIGDRIQSHGAGPHANATMTHGSSTVSINGKVICRAGDLASCGDAATGSSTVFCG
jgi:uncharacterized Zn-binding protein involved in type VI secretion